MEERKSGSVIVECSLCLCVFRDPRLLPCGHTFCLPCLQRQVLSARENRSHLCALCRKSWEIPNEGVSSLPKNYCLIDIDADLLEAKISDDTVACSMVGDGKKHGRREWLCLECHQPFCSNCRNLHLQNNFTKLHAMVKIFDNSGEKKQNSECDSNLSNSKCSRHIEEKLTLFCVECSQLMCTICYAVAHFKHESTEIQTADNQFSVALKQLQKDIASKQCRYNDGMAQLQEKLSSLCIQKDLLRKEVSERKEQAVHSILEAVHLVMDEVNKQEEESMHDIETKFQNEQNKILALLSQQQSKHDLLSHMKNTCAMQLSQSNVAKKLKSLNDIQIAMEAFKEENEMPRELNYNISVRDCLLPSHVSFSQNFKQHFFMVEFCR